MRLDAFPDGFDLTLDSRVLVSHRADAPAFFVGRGEPRIQMYRGNFDIEDRLEARIPLGLSEIEQTPEGWRISLWAGRDPAAVLTVTGGEAGVVLELAPLDPSVNRLWMRLRAEPGERTWGGGEQMSHLDLRGRRFPMWTSEPGVGRDKTTRITFEADRAGRAGGDFWTTNYPQPTFLSSRGYALHLSTTAWSALDFRDTQFHEVEVWAAPLRVELLARATLLDLVTAMSDRFGRQPPLPDWVLEGAIIGLKDGLKSFERLEAYLEAGAAVSGLWCEDWAGLRETSFGKRLFWDWRASDARYPGLRERIAALGAQGIRFLAYVNPYLCDDGVLFREAEEHGFLATSEEGVPYRVDFGEFDAGIVDFTIPEAARWFEDRIIGREMLELGIAGWMADFGEYLPTDARLAGGDAMLLHNAWPVLWAEVNARAVARHGRTGDAIFFMRAGYSGVQAHCPLLWAGDQSVDFSRHDGLVTTVVGALSAGLLGNAYSHSDIGGYTSLFGNVRTPELLKRWSELAAFTPVMRSHEGNRPTENLQLDGDPDVLAHFARMTRIHAALAPYLRRVRMEAVERGWPMQRPLFLHHEDDPQAFDVWDAFLLGRDVLFAPIWHEGEQTRSVYLPSGVEWVHLWTGEVWPGAREATIAAPFGRPAVFFRRDAADSDLFESIRAL